MNKVRNVFLINFFMDSFNLPLLQREILISGTISLAKNPGVKESSLLTYFASLCRVFGTS